MNYLPFRRINTNKVFLATVLTASGASALHRRELDLITLIILVVIACAFGLLYRFWPKAVQRIWEWFTYPLIADHVNGREEALWQLGQLNFVVGATSLTLSVGGVPAFPSITIFLIGSIAMLIYTYKILEKLQTN